jgi:hypothetical protein
VLDSYRCSEELMPMVMESIRFVSSVVDLSRVYGSHLRSGDSVWCSFFEDACLYVPSGDVMRWGG